MDAMVWLYYLIPLCFVINGTIAYFTEIPKISFAETQALGFMTLFANAAVAFSLNVATVILISNTTSLGMTLCGVFKNIVIVLASMMIFGDPISPLQGFGYSIALASLVYYQLSGDKANMEKITEIYERACRARESVKQRSPVAYYVALSATTVFVVAGLVGAVLWTGTLPPDYDIARIAILKAFEAIGKTHE